MKFIILIILLTSLNAFSFQGKGMYQIQKANITYNVKYLLKDIDGTSTNVKGLANCNTKSCDLIVATPTKAFKSKDANRDLNMLTYTKAVKHPMVQVKLTTPNKLKIKNRVNIEITFAGVKKVYKNIQLKNEINKLVTMRAKIPLKLSDFNVERPSLMGISIDDLVPVNVDIAWKKKN